MCLTGPMKNREPCLSDEFRCNSTKCILGKWRCNGADECGDNSDEEGCRGLYDNHHFTSINSSLWVYSVPAIKEEPG